MSDNRTNLLRRVKSYEKSQQLSGYSKVVLVVDENTEFVSGNDTGMTMTVECPWGTQQIADDVLSRLRGFQYQPYEATGALIDPAAELGDGVTVSKTYGGLYSQVSTFGSLFSADISAPGGQEIDHEYPYVPRQERKITRKIGGLRSELKIQSDQILAEVESRKEGDLELKGLLQIQADRITAEVSQRVSDVEQLRSSLNVQAGQISAKVSKTGGSSSSFEWNLDDSSWVLRSNGSDVFSVNRNGAVLKGKITATSGTIGGFDILSDRLSYNNATWGGTNSTGVYLGPRGIQLGNSFSVDSSGNLVASSGTFRGNVSAGSIKFGGDDGYMDGYGIQSGTIRGGSGGEISGGSVSTFNTTGGINTSLGYADFANGVFNGWNRFSSLYGNSASIDALSVYSNLIVNTDRFFFQQKRLRRETITYKDGNGVSRSLRVVTWEA